MIMGPYWQYNSDTLEKRKTGKKMSKILLLSLAIGTLVLVPDAFATNCGQTLGEQTSATCHITSAGKLSNAITVPNTVSVGETLFQGFPNQRGEFHYSGKGALWATPVGTSLTGICQGADDTMFATGEGSCLYALKIMNTSTSVAATANQIIDIRDFDGEGDHTWPQEVLNITYLGDPTRPSNMPPPPDVYEVDSYSQQPTTEVVIPSSGFVPTFNIQTCAGSGATITLDPAVATVDVGSTFGTAKQSTYKVQCPKMVADKFSLQTTFSGPALDGYTGFGKSSGSAEGVGFQMKVNNTAVSNGSVISDIPVDNSGIAQLNFDVSYIKTAPKVTPGDLTSTVTISYLYQ
jgi:type 1 fimbria pilin